MSVSASHPNSGIAKISFVVDNANAAFVSSVLLNFLGWSWPRVSVATPKKTF